MYSIRWIFLVLMTFPSLAAVAKEVHPGQRALLREMAIETKADKATRANWKRLLEQAKFQPSIIAAISKPAEATKTWKEYRPIFITESRLRDGITFWKQNDELIKKIHAETGVAAEIIVAIIGVETSYGRITGKYKALDALTTLAFYYPPRAPFFRNELKQLLRLPSERFPVSVAEVTGSYAGAMGWGQFMPTSYANYARDYDDDGKIDLWNSRPDIVASIANYLLQHGWQKDGLVAQPALAKANAKLPEIKSTETIHTVKSLSKLGYVLKDKEVSDPELPATLLVLEGDLGTEHWITYQNFYVISRYNRSPLYSLAVYQLSQQLASGMRAAESKRP